MIMKKVLLFATCFLLLLCACNKEELETYDSGNYVYFTPDEDGKTITSECNFGYLPNVSETLLGMEISLLGAMLPEDRAYKITIVTDETTAEENVDFVLPEKYLFPSGNVVDTLWVKLINTGKYARSPKKLVIKLESNDHFTAGPLKWNSCGFTLTDYVSEPSWWNKSFVTNRLGAYSDIKYYTLVQWMGVVENLYDYSTAKLNTTATGFKTYLIEIWNAGNRLYEADGKTPLYSTIPIAVTVEPNP